MSTYVGFLLFSVFFIVSFLVFFCPQFEQLTLLYAVPYSFLLLLLLRLQLLVPPRFSLLLTSKFTLHLEFSFPLSFFSLSSPFIHPRFTFHLPL